MSAEQVWQVLDHNRLRMLGDGVFYPDLLELEAVIGGWDDWFDRWAALAGHYDAEGEAAAASGLTVTAGEKLFQSSICWQYAQFLWFHEPDRRVFGQREKVRTYRRAAPWLQPPAERVEIAFEGTNIPGYLRLPDGAVGPVPCALLIGGLESTKEESYHFENLLLRRGVATFAFDGPGQGEYFPQRPFTPDWERWTSAVVDHVQGRAEIDADRIGVLGRSLGGYLAVRSACRDRRLTCCVAFGALFDLSFFDRMAAVTQHGFRYITGIADPDEAREAIIDRVDLSDVVGELGVPLYVLHGVKDPLIPLEQAYRLERAVAHGDVTMHLEPQGDHCAHNLFHRVRPAMADWLAVQLGAGATVATR